VTTTPFNRAQLAGILAAHVDHLTAAIRANASIGLPDDELGMERAAELLGLHKRNLLADEQSAGIRLLLDAMTAALTDRSAPTFLPAGFRRDVVVAVKCAVCEYEYDEDESYTVHFESVKQATDAVRDAGWTVLADGRVLCQSDEPDHEALRAVSSAL
jgi:hypothetical protein